jgi:signal transduction histidine kinase
MRKYFYGLCCLWMIISCQKKLSEDKTTNTRLDSLIQKSKKPNLSKDSVQYVLTESMSILASFQNDSVKRAYLNQVSNQYFNQGLMQDYFKVCKFNLQLAIEAQDSVLMPAIHYDLTDYYYYYSVYDSAYYHVNKSIKILQNREESLLLGRAYLNKAAISHSQNAQIEAEIDAIYALKIGESFDDNRLVYDVYNLLGVIFSRLNDFIKSEEYHLNALNTLKFLKEDVQYVTLQVSTYNNLGNTYKGQEKYQDALFYYQKGLKIENLKNKMPLLYAVLFSNLNHTKLKIGLPVSLADFEVSLKTREKLNLKEGIAHSRMHIGDFYMAKQDTVNALVNYKQALFLSDKTKKHEDVLKMLMLLSVLEPTKSNEYMERHIFLSDSLNTAERNIRNKFTRIAYETELVEAQKKVLQKQNKWIVIIALLMFLLGTMFYIVFRQKAKQKELILMQKQQKSNQEVINLMIDQQHKLEEGRSLEKNRISRELHDGVLSELGGIRLNMNVLYQRNDAEAIEICIKEIQHLQALESTIRIISHDLNQEVFFQNETFLVILQNLAKDMQKTHNLAIDMIDAQEIRWDLYNNEYKINVYRTIQEAIQNCVKHAEATLVEIMFEEDENHLVWTISDNGVGFDTQKKKKGIGLKNMQSRVALMNGHLIIDSSMEKGTKLSFTIPSNLK